MIRRYCYDPTIDLDLGDYDALETGEQRDKFVRQMIEKSKSYSKQLNKDMYRFVEDARDAIIDILESGDKCRCIKNPTGAIDAYYDEFDEYGYEYVVFYEAIQQMHLDYGSDDCMYHTSIKIYSSENRDTPNKLMIYAYTTYDTEHWFNGDGNPVNVFTIDINSDYDRFFDDEVFFEELGELGGDLDACFHSIIRKIPEKHSYVVTEQEESYGHWTEAIAPSRIALK